MKTSKNNDDAVAIKRALEIFKAKKERLEQYLKNEKKPDPTARVALDQLELMKASGFFEAVDGAPIDEQRASKEIGLNRKYSAVSKEKLISLLIAKEFELEDAIKELDRIYKINAFLLARFDKSGSKYLTDKKRQKIGVNKANEENRLALEKCMQVLSNRIQREIRPTDYPAFVAIVEEHNPTQPHVKATRVFKNEGLKTKEQRDSAAKETKRTRWTDGNMRNVFEEISGVKATTLYKSSSLKS